MSAGSYGSAIREIRNRHADDDVELRDALGAFAWHTRHLTQLGRGVSSDVHAALENALADYHIEHARSRDAAAALGRHKEQTVKDRLHRDATDSSWRKYAEATSAALLRAIEPKRVLTDGEELEEGDAS